MFYGDSACMWKNRLSKMKGMLILCKLSTYHMEVDDKSLLKSNFSTDDDACLVVEEAWQNIWLDGS